MCMHGNTLDAIAFFSRTSVLKLPKIVDKLAIWYNLYVLA